MCTYFWFYLLTWISLKVGGSWAARNSFLPKETQVNHLRVWFQWTCTFGTDPDIKQRIILLKIELLIAWAADSRKIFIKSLFKTEGQCQIKELSRWWNKLKMLKSVNLRILENFSQILSESSQEFLTNSHVRILGNFLRISHNFS